MSQAPLRVYLAGQESLLIHCAEALLERGHTILGVVTRAQPIAEWAEGHQIPRIAPGKDLAGRLGEAHDYFFSITNLSMIPAEVLALPSRGAVNFHDGPLPRYAGLYATAWAVLHQERSHGITWHVMTDEVDAGEILKQRVFDLREDETSFTLNTKCYGAAIESFGELIDELAAGTNKPVAQPSDGRTYFGLTARPDAAATLVWEHPAQKLEALTRALDFGPVDNPLASAKFTVGDELVTVIKATAIETSSETAAGTITRIDDDGIAVATGAGELLLRELRSQLGLPIGPAELAERHGLQVGSTLGTPSLDQQSRISEVNQSLCRHEPFWVKRLESFTPVELPYAERAAGGQLREASSEFSVPEAARALDADALLAAFGAYAGRISNAEAFDLAFRDLTLADGVAGADAYFASHVPLRVALDLTTGFGEARQAIARELDQLRKRGSYASDTIARHPQLRSRSALLSSDRWRVTVEQVSSVDDYQPPAGAELAVVLSTGDGDRCVWHYDAAVFSADVIAEMQRQFATFLTGLALDSELSLAKQPILSEQDQRKVLVDWNATASDYPRDACIHQLFEAQVERTPDAPALAFLGQELSYAQLDARANQLAHHLIGLGVGPDVLVGVCVDRSIDMLVATLGVMKAGGAYVPMDPAYPADRLALMLEDSKVPVLVTQEALLRKLPEHAAEPVLIDADWPVIAGGSALRPATQVSSKNLAYAIYTSGSTGRPKGVMVEHRNVANFFTGMDASIGPRQEGDGPGVWLAVTSLSFDISVLELFWTLARGLKIVLHSDRADDAALARSRQRHADKPISFSLMYFASDEGENESSKDKYKLLLEGAKFGDKNGFAAVWTPERHFHAFGGLYPNPAVAGAALATITEHIDIRSASVVMPLHHPIRVAEEWSLVDNLSNGRAGIAFASGWQPNDFIIHKPERFADRKKAMIEDVKTVCALWRGEKFKAVSPLGVDIEVQTLPRPVQKELPFWLTAAGNPETFRAAGELGANLLTHLLGQSLEEVEEKIKIYRAARKKAGHQGRGSVTVMLHTFVGPDSDEVRETVREPMKAYLKSSVQLIKLAAWSFPTFKKKADATGKTPAQIFEEEELSPEDLDTVLEHSFNRYYKTSGLFGTPEQCLEMVDQLKGIDVDDIGCLLDYGVPSAKVLEHLPYVNQLKEMASNRGQATADYSLPAQISRHGVTHLQCTPSQMGMILAGDESRAALRSLEKVMVGGEAFPAALARDLATATDGNIINMYGPTETTIWSCTAPVSGQETSVSIGRPIANTSIYLLDRHLQPVPIGAPGELWIGGEGVVRGYFERPDLTAERFVPDPFNSTDDARMYRTGDLARYHEDGSIEFLGRVDFQVKLRGYRIELGEIESHIATDDKVREAVVIAREDVPGDKRLVAYMLANGAGSKIDIESLRSRLKEQLPDYMVPASFVVLDKFPLTPNAKVDRKALPAPDKVEVRSTVDYVEPDGQLESTIAKVWAEVLNVEQVGMDDNFFDLGGHSLLTVQAHRRLKQELDKPLALTDLFRFPTIRALVEFLEGDGASKVMEKSKDRADARKAAMSRRAKARDRRRPRR